jgi:1-phosphatidylinositol-3-phosphate 5-kinase
MYSYKRERAKRLYPEPAIFNIKIGCTVFCATAFDNLRTRCAVDKSIIASLSRSSKWDAQGGKSKASFFMTEDKRYVVKELVSEWNVSDT